MNMLEQKKSAIKRKVLLLKLKREFGKRVKGSHQEQISIK